MDIVKRIRTAADGNESPDIFMSLNGELRQALSIYWDIATEMLDNSGITVPAPERGYFSLENNFFSSLFLYSYFRAGISAHRRVLYAAANQCLRGMVTGCDNILDNEYKKTLETDLPEQAVRFRSVLDIMVSDRVLFAILQKGYVENDLTLDQMRAASFESLRTLIKSGAQEASEEGGAGKILSPENVLAKVHHYKTGILFLAPWALPDVIETHDAVNASEIRTALYQIGMGCQIFDDMVDLEMDVRNNHHNYVVSLIDYGDSLQEKAMLESVTDSGGKTGEGEGLLLKFPDARRAAVAKALEFLTYGTDILFGGNHQFMADMAIAFIAKRIGADRFLYDVKG